MIKNDDLKLVEGLRKLLDEKEGEDIVVLNMENTSLMLDYFIIVTGNSDTHTAALRDYVVKYFKDSGRKIKSFDREKGTDWLTIDEGGIIVHIFTREGREFYNLETLWEECPRV